MICNKLIYLCQRTSTENVETATYKSPKPYYLNYQPVSGYTYVMQYGERVEKISRAILNFDQFVGVFNEGDLVYLCGKNKEDGTPPTINATYVNGRGANAIVRSVRNQNKAIQVIFEKLI